MSAATFHPVEAFDPSQMSFTVTVPPKTTLPSKMPTALSTTYAEWQAMGYPGAYEGEDSMGDYVYAYFTETQRGPAFTFVKPRTASESLVAVPSRTYITWDIYPWPDVIEWICAVENRDQPIQFEVRGRRIDVPSLSLRMSKIKGGAYVTQHKVEYFVSHQPFPESFFRSDPPVPGVVYAQIRNLVVDEFALHPALELPALQKEGNILPGFGYVPPDGTVLQAQALPATNHLTWIPHVAKEHVELIKGLYVMVRTSVKPPKIKNRLRTII
jgi:hypothetical protein